MWRSPDDGFYPHFDRADDFDARLARQVRERLDAGDRGVRVDVQNGVALLSGTVASTAMHRAALQAAWSVPGLRDVCDAVHVLDDPGGAASGSAEPDVDRVFAEIIADVLAAQPPRPVRRRRPYVTWTVVGLLALAWACACMAVLVLSGPGGAVACQLITVIAAITIAWRSPRRHRSRRTGTARWDRGYG